MDKNLDSKEVFEKLQKTPEKAEEIFSNFKDVSNDELLENFRDEKEKLVTAAQGWQ